jgi:lactobin A/cerein 7B family class IIb bacteriocin
MNKLDVNALGVSELSENEMIEIDGGFLPLIIALAIGGAILLSKCS